MTWEELVVFSNPHTEHLRKHSILSTEDCKDIKILVEHDYPQPDIPIPTEFIDVVTPLILEREYDEVAPFPYANRVRIATRILRGGKILQWRDLYAGKKYPSFRPFKAWRGSDGVVVEFIDPKEQLKTVPIPNCRRACWIGNHIQCAAFGSYSQIELNNLSILPLWNGECSAESALTCPMRLAAIKGGFPTASLEEPVVKAFQEWCKTRKGIVIK